MSVSLFGSNKKYLAGAKKLAKSVLKNLPGWKIVFFVGDSVPMKYLESLEATGAILLRVRGKEDLRSTAWRFHLNKLSNPEWVIFRDSDSVISKREASAVSDWVGSGLDAHIIRDHPFHTSKILAGLWGIRPAAFPWFQGEVENYNFEDFYGSDQSFLNTRVYPRIISRSMVHASFHRHDSDGISAEFRIGSSRLGQFCGESVTENLIVRTYARFRRLVDSRTCSCAD